MLLLQESSVSGFFCLSPGADALNRLMPEPRKGSKRRWISQGQQDGDKKPCCHFLWAGIQTPACALQV